MTAKIPSGGQTRKAATNDQHATPWITAPPNQAKENIWDFVGSMNVYNFNGIWYNDTVDGRNPAPADMVNIPLFTRFYTSQVVQDFFLQPYYLKMCTRFLHCHQDVSAMFCLEGGNSLKFSHIATLQFEIPDFLVVLSIKWDSKRFKEINWSNWSFCSWKKSSCVYIYIYCVYSVISKQCVYIHICTQLRNHVYTICTVSNLCVFTIYIVYEA